MPASLSDDSEARVTAAAERSRKGSGLDRNLAYLGRGGLGQSQLEHAVAIHGLALIPIDVAGERYAALELAIRSLDPLVVLLHRSGARR